MKLQWQLRRQQTFKQAIRSIQATVSEQADFWGNSHGWAPKDAAKLLSAIRLEQYASLALNLDSTMLRRAKSPDHESGRLIIAWAHLGSLVECTLQLLLSVHLRDYQKDPNRIYNRRRGATKLAMPHEAMLENLRVFLDKSVWSPKEKQKWSPWILDIQQHRNAIHAMKPRPMGTWDDLKKAVKTYSLFLREVDSRLPRP